MATDNDTAVVPLALRDRYEQAGQGHVFDYWSDLSSLERSSLLEQLSSIPVESLSPLLAAATGSDSLKKTIEPFVGDNVGSIVETPSDIVQEYWKQGLEAIAKGHVAALVLAGGQGTRLGFDGPKGMYDIHLPSHKSLFQLICERILKLQQLAAAVDSGEEYAATLPLYIMTSPMNHEATLLFFEQHKYFGVKKDNVVLFQQGMLPCLTLEGGKIIMETASRVAMAPDGNGGIYPSLLKSGALDDMEQKRGIKYVHVFSIDNALVQPADPIFLGFCRTKNADCGNKSTRKSHAHERVGVVALADQKPCVVEYSEITTPMAEQTDDKGRLVFGAANICNHFFTVHFLRSQVLPHMVHLYHVAKKKIPYYDATTKTTIQPENVNNGIKLETFIFDVFSLSRNFCVWEVHRWQEFAPVKNAPGSDAGDSPDTARIMISNLHQSWLKAAGANLVVIDDHNLPDTPLCEISPLLSYNGEGLEPFQNQSISLPCHLTTTTTTTTSTLTLFKPSS